MKLMGFNLNKISAERNTVKPEKININTEIKINNIEKPKSDFLKTKEDILNISFDYIINYNKDFGKISFSGNLLIAVDAKISKDVLKKWKDKKMPPEFKINIFNIIMRRANIRALDLEDTINLPLHAQLPYLQPPKKEEENK